MENANVAPAIRKLLHSHTQPLRSDTTGLLPESPLSKHKGLGSFCSKASACKSVQGTPHPSPQAQPTAQPGQSPGSLRASQGRF